jgi:hypothetical protein
MDKPRHPLVVRPWKWNRQRAAKGYAAPVATHPHPQGLRPTMPRNPKRA